MSFWTVGEELYLTSATEDGKTYRMKLVKGNPGYSISEPKSLIAWRGTELLIKPLLPGIRSLSGERIQNYLASELRDRISKSGVRILIVDKAAHKEIIVEPRRFSGRLLHNLPSIRSPFGDIYCELYMNEPSPDNELGLYKNGTRVLSNLSVLDGFDTAPWNSPYLEGIIDCSYIQLTPGTRDGIIRDNAFDNLIDTLKPLGEWLEGELAEMKKAEEETASKAILHRVTKAFRDAFAFLADEQYAWMATGKKKHQQANTPGNETVNEAEISKATLDEDIVEGALINNDNETSLADEQRAFFDYPGPLRKITIIPAKAVIPVGGERKLRVLCRDRKGKRIDSGVKFDWAIAEGSGELVEDGAYALFKAGSEPGVSRLSCSATDGKNSAEAEAYLTVTAELVSQDSVAAGTGKGLPGYTYQRASGELWRSRYDPETNIITINNGHSDFIFASKLRMRHLRYIARLFAKELILFNFPGIAQDEALERMTELLLYLDECL